MNTLVTGTVAAGTTGESTRAYAWKDVPHLAQRTLWSLRKPAPDPEGEQWLLTQLTPAETVLYRSMAEVDRAHAIDCAKAVEQLGTEVVVASALHDVGKTQSGLGTPGRVAASFAGLLIPDEARTWDTSGGLRGQIGRYLDHSEIGARALEAAGASALAVAWAREHHLPQSMQTIDPEIRDALHAADT
jgi:hypothetical protein